MVETAESFKMGDPTSSDTYLGPMALPSAPAFLQSQVDDAVAKGATLHVGGALVQDQPRFYPPTVLSGVDHTMSLMRDESFGASRLPSTGVLQSRHLTSASPRHSTAPTPYPTLERPNAPPDSPTPQQRPVTPPPRYFTAAPPALCRPDHRHPDRLFR